MWRFSLLHIVLGWVAVHPEILKWNARCLTTREAVPRASAFTGCSHQNSTEIWDKWQSRVNNETLVMGQEQKNRIIGCKVYTLIMREAEKQEKRVWENEVQYFTLHNMASQVWKQWGVNAVNEWMSESWNLSNLALASLVPHQPLSLPDFSLPYLAHPCCWSD